jgi:thiol-disulfide isomerase/thioredoxin
MNISRQTLAIVLVATLAAAAGLGLSLNMARDPVGQPAARAQASVAGGAEVGSPRPSFSLPDTDGRPRQISEWDGKVLLVNFWATWCPPCKKEIPALIALQDRLGPRGLQVIGVAIDQPDLVRAFGEELGINYPSLVGELEAATVIKDWGNQYGTLPYSVIVDRQGRITATRLGELTEAQAEALVRDLL